MRNPKSSSPLRLGLAVAATALGVGGASAQVLEIDGSGAVTVYDRPGVFTAAGRSPIAPEAEPKAGRSRAQRTASPEVARHIADAAAAYRVEPRLLESVAWRESGFSQSALSSKGAAGVMQLMPGTARELGVDASDVRQNIFGGAYYLKTQLQRFGGDVSLALAAYNAGPGAVMRHRGIPPFAETRAYVSAITARLGAQSTLAPALSPPAAVAVFVP